MIFVKTKQPPSHGSIGLIHRTQETQTQLLGLLRLPLFLEEKFNNLQPACLLLALAPISSQTSVALNLKRSNESTSVTRMSSELSLRFQLWVIEQTNEQLYRVTESRIHFCKTPWRSIYYGLIFQHFPPKFRMKAISTASFLSRLVICMITIALRFYKKPS
jgi:hypothetical protein